MKIDLSSLPKFIDGSRGSIWRLPDQYPQENFETVYVKLVDVERLLEDCQRREARNNNYTGE